MGEFFEPCSCRAQEHTLLTLQMHAQSGQTLQSGDKTIEISGLVLKCEQCGNSGLVATSAGRSLVKRLAVELQKYRED